MKKYENENFHFNANFFQLKIIYLKLKESMRKKDSQIGDTERDRLIEHSKRIGIDVIFKQNERQSLKL